MVFLNNFMKTTQIIRIDTKIYKALQKINNTLENDDSEPKIYTTSQLANYILEWYIKHMYTNGNDYIDRD